MPIMTLNLRKGRSAGSRRKFADAIQASLVSILGIPNEDRFALVREYESEDFIHTDAFLDLRYSPQLLMIEISFLEGRSDDLKKSLLRDINERLVATGEIAADDVFIIIHEVSRVNVSFGKGLAQRAA